MILNQQQQHTCTTGVFVMTNYTTNTAKHSLMFSETYKVTKRGDCFLSSWQIEPRQVKMVKTSSKLVSSNTSRTSSSAITTTPIAKPCKMRNECSKTPSQKNTKLTISFILNSTPAPLIKVDPTQEFQLAMLLNNFQATPHKL